VEARDVVVVEPDLRGRKGPRRRRVRKGRSGVLLTDSCRASWHGLNDGGRDSRRLTHRWDRKDEQGGFASAFNRS
jgi:hypothetical protein